MYVLGVHDGHDAGAAILQDGRIVAAVNEERLTRRKLYTGLPGKSINTVLDLVGISVNDLDAVAISGTLGIMAGLGWEKLSFKKKFYQFISNKLGLSKYMWFSNLQRFLFKPFRDRGVEHYLRSLGYKRRFVYVDHHLSHAASAYYTSGKNECLVVTADGSGDGLSGSVYVGKDGVLTKIKEIPTFHSVAYFYAYVTYLSGFKMFKHEGKITGLAAFGDPNACYAIFERCFAYDQKKGQTINYLGLIGVPAMKWLRQQLVQYRREDWAAGLQRRFDEVLTDFIVDYVKKTGVRDVAVAGGAFANVKTNQRILEHPEINSLFIHPHMGDGGQAAGAALYVAASLLQQEGKRLLPYVLENVYFGPSYTNEYIEKAIVTSGLKGTFIRDIEKYVAKQVAAKKVVGHFFGRMEYGPRALGNRSVLADPTDRSINDWLNKRMRRTEFMPFAPSILDEAAQSYYNGCGKGFYPAEFMTITFDTTKEAKKGEAVVHVDNTTRPQVVSAKSNQRYYRILQEYKKLTGLPLFVNTSFNMHEEPIVCSPEDAINSFKLGMVDVLVMENWVVENLPFRTLRK